MNNWEEATLGEVVRINTSSIGKDFIFDDILYLDTGSITKGKIEELQKVSLSEAPSRAKRKVQNEDIVYSTVRPNQEHYGFIKNPEKNLIVSTGFAVIKAKKNLADPKYIYFFLTQENITNRLQQLAEHTTSTYPSIKPEHLSDLEINLPSLPEQKAITQVLNSLDDKIELLRKQNETLEKIAQTIFKQWFVEFEFPDKNGKPYKSSGGKMIESELGEIPEGWRVGVLGDEINIKQGKYIKAEEIAATVIDEKKYPIYGGNGIRGYIKDFMYEKPQVILTCRGNGCGLILFAKEKSAISNSCMAFEDMYSVLSSEFLYLWAKKISFESVTSGSAQPQITVTNLYGLEIVIPDSEVLEKFNIIVKPIFKITIKNLDQIQTLSRLRDTLLPKLMSGEVRVK